MKILLANHHLHERAGSELYTSELAGALRQHGQQVAVFTLLPGTLAEELRRSGVPVFGPDDAAAIEAFSPEVLHVHHAPCLYLLGAMRLESAVLFSSLGVIPVLEAAPSIWAGVGLGLAVSEEVQSRLADTAFGRSVPLAVFRNWFVDEGEPPPVRRVRELRRVAVVTNHLDGTLRDNLEQIRRRRAEFEWVHFGMPDNSVELTASVLEPFDAVITIGRSALLAASVGKPVLLLDLHGSDGWLTADRIEALSTRNFSGRLEGRRLGAEELEYELFEVAPRLELEAATAAIWRDFRLSSRVETLLGRYEQLRGGGPHLDGATREAYGRTGALYLEALRQSEERRARIDELVEVLGVHKRHIVHVEQQLETAGRRASELETELAEVRLHLEAGHREIAGLRTELESAKEGLQQLAESAPIRLMQKVRSSKDRLLPAGTSRRAVYERTVRLFKRTPTR